MPEAKITIEESHGRHRVALRGDLALPAAVDTRAMNHDPATGQFKPKNLAQKRRALKARARGLVTMNPAEVEPWLTEHAKAAIDYAVQLSESYPDPLMNALIGDAANARAMTNAFLQLGAQGDREAIREARQWMKEHRTLRLTLAALWEQGADDRRRKADNEAFASAFASMTCISPESVAEQRKESWRQEAERQQAPKPPPLTPATPPNWNERLSALEESE